MTMTNNQLGALLEESDHEQANMFIRTIKMINEQGDDTIRQLLSGFLASRGTSDRERGVEGELLKSGNGMKSRGASVLKSKTRTKTVMMKQRDDDATGFQEIIRSASSKIDANSEEQLLDEPEIKTEASHEEAPIVLEADSDSNPDTTIHQSTDSIARNSAESGNKLHRDNEKRGPRRTRVKLEPMIEFLDDRQSSLEADSKVCQLIESGVHAIFGPTDGASIQHVQSICDNMEIPYFELRPFLGSSPAGPPLYTSPSSFSSVSTVSPLSPSSSVSVVNAHSKEVADSLNVPNQHQQQQQHGSISLKEPLNGAPNDLGSNFANVAPANTASNTIDKPVDTGRDNLLLAPTSKFDSHQQRQQLLPWQAQLNRVEDLTLNLYPPTHLLTSAYIDLIYAWNWTSFAIVYEDGNSMIKLQDLFKESSGTWTSKWQIKLFQFNQAAFSVAQQQPDHHDYVQQQEQQQQRQQPRQQQREHLSSYNNNNNNYYNHYNSNYDIKDNNHNNNHNHNDHDDQVRNNFNSSHAPMAVRKLQLQQQRHATLKGEGFVGVNNKAFTSWQAAQTNATASPAWFASPVKTYEYPSEVGGEGEAEAGTGTGTGAGAEHESRPGAIDEPADFKLPNKPGSSSSSSRDFVEEAGSVVRSGYGSRDSEFASFGFQSDQATAKSNSQISPPSTLFANAAATAAYKNKKRLTTGSFRDIFWRIKMSGEQNILLDVKTEHLYEALKHAQQVGCMTERYSYLITSLDLHTIDMEDFKYSRTRITAFNMIQVAKFQPESHLVPNTNDPAAHANDAAAASSSSPSPSSFSFSAPSHLNKQQQSFAVDNNADVKNGAASAAAADKGNDERKGNKETTKASLLSETGSLFDEKYLEKLGVHVIQNTNQIDPFRSAASKQQASSYNNNNNNGQSHPTDNYYYSANRNGYATTSKQGATASRLAKYKLSPSVVLERSGSYMEPPIEAYRDWNRREMLMSSPASMGLLPSVDRDHEQRLFEFFVTQQNRNLSRVRLSTSSAIIHDSLILYMLGLNELDPNGTFVGEQQSIACSLNSQPWLHGSSLVNYMRQISFNGLTGPISFDQRGLRSDFKLDVMGMAPDIGLIKVGEWYSKYATSERLMALNSGKTSSLSTLSSSSSASYKLRDLNPKGRQTMITTKSKLDDIGMVSSVASESEIINAPPDTHNNDNDNLDQKTKLAQPQI